MATPFSDITLYSPTPHRTGTEGYWEDRSLENFVSDLYVQKMNGYKPPGVTRITIQPGYYGTWDRTWKNGSIVAIATYFNYEDYAKQDIKGRYKYILDVIQNATIALSEEYGWDKSVFENAYSQVIECDFRFRMETIAKQSRDRKKKAKLVIEKTEVRTSLYIMVEHNGTTIIRKLFDKKNMWWYDPVYILARHAKWFDNDRFGISYRKEHIEAWYSIEKDAVMQFVKEEQVNQLPFNKYLG
jgi:hypothetical protein